MPHKGPCLCHAGPLTASGNKGANVLALLHNGLQLHTAMLKAIKFTLQEVTNSLAKVVWKTVYWVGLRRLRLKWAQCIFETFRNPSIAAIAPEDST